MFDADPAPRLFSLPPGCDYPSELIAGLADRLEGQPPEAWAEVEIFVNTSRMRRRLIQLFAEGPPRLLPRIRLLTQLASDPSLIDLPPAQPPLRRTLELASLVRKLLEADPTLAPRSALYDLADSLAGLFDEMHGEGVPLEALQALEVGDVSAHWQRSLRFLEIAAQVVEADALPSAEARLRAAAETLAERWAVTPPRHPIIIAGSTGSRGPVALLMQAVAHLPQGAVILPGVDPHMPSRVWDGMEDDRTYEDHPQFRFVKLARAMGLDPATLPRWTGCEPVRERAALLSLALRPAPVTDQWMEEGPRLGDMRKATAGLSLIEAADPGEEAAAIALRLRRATDEGKRAALISPDRMLTRRVQAALDRWGIVADDSAGLPLHLTPPGRLLRQTAAIIGAAPGPEALLALLKHPLTGSGQDRNAHLLRARRLDLWLRENSVPHMTTAVLADWAEDEARDPGARDWAVWVGGMVDRLAAFGTAPLADLVRLHLSVSEELAADLWGEAPGRAARLEMDRLLAEAPYGDVMAPAEYLSLIDTILAGGEVRRPDEGRSDVMIWGTLEARVQGADLVILAGLSEGTWPEPPAPDPWLNREMRYRLGLLLPERRIGLAAHDFEQAACAPEVVFSRACRDAEAEAVMSRWLNRLTNLLSGLHGNGGPEALREMRERGNVWVRQARLSAARTIRSARASRPSPRPPVAARPKRLSVTQVQTLVRDPYAIYASKVLGLRKLPALRPEPDALLRGNVLHEILETWLREGHDPTAPDARDALMRIARSVLEGIPWQTARLGWMAQVEGFAGWFLEGEARRRAEATPLEPEKKGRFEVPGSDFVLTGKADRLDLRPDGRLVVIDYKTGSLPTARQLIHFDKQLMLEAVMAEAGAFEGVPPAEVARVSHIGLGSQRKETLHDLRQDGEDTLDPGTVLTMLQRLLKRYDSRSQGYTSLRAIENMIDRSDYAHLARFGEWDLDDEAAPEDVG